MRSLCNFGSCNKRQRSEQNNDQSNFNIDSHHEYQRTDNRYNAAEKLCEALKQTVRNYLYIVDNTACKFAFCVTVNIFKRNTFQFIENVSTKVTNGEKRKLICT